jgi:hypothetical protein
MAWIGMAEIELVGTTPRDSSCQQTSVCGADQLRNNGFQALPAPLNGC